MIGNVFMGRTAIGSPAGNDIGMMFGIWPADWQGGGAQGLFCLLSHATFSVIGSKSRLSLGHLRFPLKRNRILRNALHPPAAFPPKMVQTESCSKFFAQCRRIWSGQPDRVGSLWIITLLQQTVWESCHRDPSELVRATFVRIIVLHEDCRSK